MISEGWQETSFVTSCCDSPSFSTASGDLLSDYNFFISRWLHRSCFRLENRINLFSVSFFWFWLLCWNWFGILTFSMNFMPLSLLYACCQDCVCKKSTNALLRDVCKSVVEGEQHNEEKHDIPIATVAKLFMLMLSRKLPVI